MAVKTGHLKIKMHKEDTNNNKFLRDAENTQKLGMRLTFKDRLPNLFL